MPDSGSRLSLVVTANEHVPFVVAARLAGVDDVPEARATGSRAWCPFGEFSHPDGGREKALRVYYDHGFCFAEWLWLSPVRIFAMMRGLAEEEAAEQLLAQTGYQRGSYAEEWDALVSAPQVPDRSALAQALRIWLEGNFPEWGDRQYESDAAGALSGCLGLLGSVETDADCEFWLDSAKTVMTRYLGGDRD